VEVLQADILDGVNGTGSDCYDSVSVSGPHDFFNYRSTTTGTSSVNQKNRKEIYMGLLQPLLIGLVHLILAAIDAVIRLLIPMAPISQGSPLNQVPLTIEKRSVSRRNNSPIIFSNSQKFFIL
jgi:hypothetical protein